MFPKILGNHLIFTQIVKLSMIHLEKQIHIIKYTEVCTKEVLRVMKNVIVRELIFIDTEFKTQDEVLNFIASRLFEAGRCSDVSEVVRGFYDREAEFSTCMNDGIAIPHCLNQAISDATVIVVRNQFDIPWPQKEDQANLFFSLLIPKKNENQMHIRILAQVAQLIMEDDFIKNVRDSENTQIIYDLLKDLNKTFEMEKEI